LQTQLWRKLVLGFAPERDFALQIEGQTLLVANAGDSRCVVSESGKAVAMSYDHKPTDAAEHSRIIKVGAQTLSKKFKNENRHKSEKTPAREQITHV
jgi:serine/threonine protein phosphatase PrpC